jgi:hypothetical protein
MHSFTAWYPELTQHAANPCRCDEASQPQQCIRDSRGAGNPRVYMQPTKSDPMAGRCLTVVSGLCWVDLAAGVVPLERGCLGSWHPACGQDAPLCRQRQHAAARWPARAPALPRGCGTSRHVQRRGVQTAWLDASRSTFWLAAQACSTGRRSRHYQKP